MNLEDYKKCIQNNKFLEFYGILMGDGCLSKYTVGNSEKKIICITCNAIKDKAYVEKYVNNLIITLFKTKPKIRIRKDNTIELKVYNKQIFEFLNKVGFPTGIKGQIKIPNSIIKLPAKKINHLIRGFFDTDGCITARKDEKYRYPIIFISTKSDILRKQFKTLLTKQGFPTYTNKWDAAIKGIGNFKKWFKVIGSSNKRNLSRYEEFTKTGRLASIGYLQ